MIKKRQFVVVALSLLIVAGAYITNKREEPVQTVMNQEVSESPKVYGEAQFVNGTGENLFESARINRDRARGEALDLLREITQNPENESQAVNDAIQTMTKMATATEQEGKIENELKAKGFGDAVVYITDAGATINLSSQSFKEEEISKILSLVINETGFGTDKIKIIEIK